MLPPMSFETFDHSEFQRFAHSGARNLPFPLATVAWSYLSAASPSARLDSLFDFMQVAARLVGIINLSAMRADRDLYLEARPSLKGVGPSPGTLMRRATLGGWVKLDLSLAKSLRCLSDEQRRQLYRVDRLARVAPLISRDLGQVLEEGLAVRNEWEAHSGATSASEIGRRVERLEGIVGRFWGITEDVWSQYLMIRPGSGTTRRRTFNYQVEMLRGSNLQFRRESAEFSTTLEDQSLYFWDWDMNQALYLEPLIRVLPTSDDNHACYFHDRIQAAGVRWLSYHYGGPELPLEPPDPELLAVIEDLDEPAVDGASL